MSETWKQRQALHEEKARVKERFCASAPGSDARKRLWLEYGDAIDAFDASAHMTLDRAIRLVGEPARENVKRGELREYNLGKIAACKFARSLTKYSDYDATTMLFEREAERATELERRGRTAVEQSRLRGEVHGLRDILFNHVGDW